MSEAIKPTRGPWELWGDANPSQVISSPAGFVAQTLGSNDEANARLIAEAGTVHHETGLTPRQLVERVKELEGALIRAKEAINSMKVEAETAAQGDEQMMLEACETISNEGLDADMEIRDTLSKALHNADAKEAGK